jgi:NAD-dependent dihydropyrimidine dehydrogenase PreA subunit
MIAITINRSKCTNCLQCIDLCPAGVLRAVDGRPVHVYAERCEECGTCMNICPEDAIIAVKC